MTDIAQPTNEVVTIEEYQRRERESRKFTAWRKRAARAMQGAANRVFALRSVAYNGHGFHYGLESDVGYCMFKLNDYHDDGYYHAEDYGNVIARRIILHVHVEMLFERIAEIEREVEGRRHWVRQHLQDIDTVLKPQKETP